MVLDHNNKILAAYLILDTLEVIPDVIGIPGHSLGGHVTYFHGDVDSLLGAADPQAGQVGISQAGRVLFLILDDIRKVM